MVLVFFYLRMGIYVEGFRDLFYTWLACECVCDRTDLCGVEHVVYNEGGVDVNGSRK